MAGRTTLTIEDGIGWITLDDGKVNAMSVEMLGEIAAALEEVEGAGAVAVVRGRPGIFSAGFDLTTFKRGRDATIAMLRAGSDVIQRILAFRYPVLTVCTGHAYPAGAFLMMAADVRFGLAGAWRIGMNETAIGLTVPYFALELAQHRLTPPGYARVSAGAMFDPGEAMRFGYLDRLLEPDALDEAVRTEAARLRTLDMASFTATKARVNAAALRAIAAATASELGTA